MSLRSKITVSPAVAVRVVALAAALLVVGAYVLEFGFGAKPCELCWLQRYAHWALLGVALLAMIQPKIAPRRALKFLAWVAVVGIGFAMYHSMVEAHMIVAGCAKSMNELATTSADMLALLAASPVPACDMPYQMLWLSLPQWNVLAQGLIVVFIMFNLRGKKSVQKAKAVQVVPAKKVVAKKPVPAKKAKPVKKPVVKKAKKATKKKGR